jgi:hypothetical protein
LAENEQVDRNERAQVANLSFRQIVILPNRDVGPLRFSVNRSKPNILFFVLLSSVDRSDFEHNGP